MKLPFLCTVPHCLPQNHRLKELEESPLQRADRLQLCQRKWCVVIPAGEGGLLSSSGLWGKRKRDKFFVMELSNFSYFYIWFSGTERSEERNLKKTGVWDGSFNQENLDQLNLSKCFLPQASFVLSSNKVMLQKEHGVSHRWSLWQIWDPIPRGTRSSQ